uniref:Retrovirus-related Pol polyprotein from transposon TNT 1-94 n=1 Tax=Tanacetum cinerariifolium TaxID=118510 RepID=A0A6L2L6N8_TANCI|nr:retrovirus-related Pol polyprotein from transposon TNT 1-94 [Tanacetum cinerariifolium]
MLAGMEPYYLKCIKDGLFQPKIGDDDAKPKSQWTPDEMMVAVQDQRMRNIIMSCIPNDVMESVISCVSSKETWTNLVYSFEGLVAEIFDWDEEEVSDDEEVTQVKILMALADDELTIRKSHARNGEWFDITIRKDHLGKFVAKADDGYLLGYSSVSMAFRVYNIRRQQIKETYNVTFNESMEAIRFTNTSLDKIRIDDSSRYHPDEFLHEDDPSRQYQVDSDISYYVIPYGRSLTKLTQENHVPEVIILNKHDVPLTEDNEDPPNLINTEGTHEKNVQDDQMITQPIDVPSGNNTKVSRPITKPLSLMSLSLTSQIKPSKHVNIIGNLGEGMLTRTIIAKLTTASASECLFVDFIFEIKPKNVSEALKHPG